MLSELLLGLSVCSPPRFCHVLHGHASLLGQTSSCTPSHLDCVHSSLEWASWRHSPSATSRSILSHLASLGISSGLELAVDSQRYHLCSLFSQSAHTLLFAAHPSLDSHALRADFTPPLQKVLRKLLTQRHPSHLAHSHLTSNFVPLPRICASLAS